MPGAGVDGGADQDGFSGHRDASAFDHDESENRPITVMLDEVLGRGAIEEMHRFLPPRPRPRCLKRSSPAGCAEASVSRHPNRTRFFQLRSMPACFTCPLVASRPQKLNGAFTGRYVLLPMSRDVAKMTLRPSQSSPAAAQSELRTATLTLERVAGHLRHWIARGIRRGLGDGLRRLIRRIAYGIVKRLRRRIALRGWRWIMQRLWIIRTGGHRKRSSARPTRTRSTKFPRNPCRTVAIREEVLSRVRGGAQTPGLISAIGYPAGFREPMIAMA